MKIFSRKKRKEHQQSTERNLSVLKKQLGEEFKPIVENADKKLVQPAKNWMQRNPYKTFAFMIGIIICNAAIIFTLDSNIKKTKDNYSTLIKETTKNVGVNNSTGERGIINSGKSILSAVKNIREIEEIQDSINLLMLKPSLTREDSLAFIRLSERVIKIQQYNNF